MAIFSAVLQTIYYFKPVRDFHIAKSALRLFPALRFKCIVLKEQMLTFGSLANHLCLCHFLGKFIFHAPQQTFHGFNLWMQVHIECLLRIAIDSTLDNALPRL